ncbi:MAG: hypothetical protein PHG95_02130 [Patescibacteria group bacterium]|nr:hypothetical protein [Patescibacteria group bacterium]
MKIFRFFFVAVACCFGLAASQAQVICNYEDEDVMLLSVSGGAGFIISAHESHQAEVIDSNYYAYLQERADYQTVRKIGFCHLALSDGIYVFSESTKLPIFLHNNSEHNVLLEFGNMAISLPPGASYRADNLVVEPDLSALVYLSGNDSVSAPGLHLLHFTITGGGVIGKFLVVITEKLFRAFFSEGSFLLFFP